MVSNNGPAKFRHDENIADYLKRIETEIVTSARARSSWNKQWAHDTAEKLVSEVTAYAQFFGLALPALPVVPALDSKELEAVKAREAKKSAERAEQTKQENIAREKRRAECAQEWRNGAHVSSCLGGLPVMLRIAYGETAQTSVVETSLGAQVPIEHAARGLRFVRAVMAKQVPYVRNGHTLHLVHYPIDRIDADGTLHAGCHVIPYSEIERIAPELEALNIPADCEETEA